MAYDSKQKYVFRKLDHICIYLAIAGSYTPVALCVVQGWVGILILVIQWSAVLAGILLKAIAKRSFPVLSTTIYLVMGWIAIIFIPFLIHSSFWFLFFSLGCRPIVILSFQLQIGYNDYYYNTFPENCNHFVTVFLSSVTLSCFSIYFFAKN